MSFPLRYAHGNVLLGRGGEAAGLYRLAMTSYPYLPTGEKWALQRRLQRLAHTISADFSLWRVSRAYPADRYVQHTAGLLDSRHQDPQVWQAFLAGHRDRLRQLGSHIPECYLAVSLAAPGPCRRRLRADAQRRSCSPPRRGVRRHRRRVAHIRRELSELAPASSASLSA